MLNLKIFVETMSENVEKGSGKGMHFIVNGLLEKRFLN